MIYRVINNNISKILLKFDDRLILVHTSKEQIRFLSLYLYTLYTFFHKPL